MFSDALRGFSYSSFEQLCQYGTLGQKVMVFGTVSVLTALVLHIAFGRLFE